MAPKRRHGEGSVYKRGRPPGQWVAVADLGYLPGGKRDRREFTAATKDEAITRRAVFLHRRMEGFTIPRGRQPYVSEWLLHWLYAIARKKVKASTWERSYRQKTEELICPWFERVLLNELTEEHVEDWHRQLSALVSKRTGRPLSPKTISDAHRIMSRAIKVAVARGRLVRNPCSNVTPPRVERVEAEPPSAAEVQLILARCGTWANGARWVVAIATGIRQGEALALRWRDVRLDGVAPSLTVRGDVKSDASRRTIPLPPVAVEALRRHRRSQTINIATGLVFTRLDGRPVHPRADWQDWQDLCTDLGLPHYRVHDLRHGTATYLLEMGVDIRTVQGILGHATPDFTRRVYQHVTPAMVSGAADAMERYLRG